MPTPVYRDVLTEESGARLARLVQDLPHPVALAGGHAVRYIVRKGWKDRFGQSYFGSRDIDVCYYVDPEWSEEEFRSSAAGQAPERIREIGYQPMGVFRFGLWVDTGGNVLDEEPGPPKMRGVDYDLLNLDPMVTHIHPAADEVLGYKPIDEPLLAHAFTEEHLRTTVEELGKTSTSPPPRCSPRPSSRASRIATSGTRPSRTSAISTSLPTSAMPAPRRSAEPSTTSCRTPAPT